MKEYQEYLEEFARQRRQKSRLWNIDEKTASLLSFLMRMKEPENILEIGTSNGYSTFHLSLAASESGGKVESIECDRDRYDLAVNNLKGRDNIVLHIGKAEDIIPKLGSKYDFIFFDANKESYHIYLQLLIPKLNDRALIIADNITSHRDSVTNYLTFIRSNPRFISINIELGSGLEISLYRKG